MHISVPKRARRIALGATAGLVLTGLAAACNYGPDGVKESLAFAGSDTTQNVMGAVIGNYNADTSYNDDPNIAGDDRDTLSNILAVQTSPLTVPADSHCAAKTYHTPPSGSEVLAPNGSGAGRDALKASVLAGDGCIDIARSSGTPRPAGTGAGQDPSTFNYYAYALDAVGWSTASPSAPANLSLSQLQGIYNCTFTNWNQVGGGNQVIKRYWPQAGSGTRNFFQSEVLGFDPTTFSSGSCPAVTLVEENEGTAIQANGDNNSALEPFSGANFSAMVNGAQTDERGSQTIHNLDGKNILTTNGSGQTVLATPEVTGDSTSPVQESNVRLNNPSPAYVGIRYVFNVADSTEVSFNSAIRYVGFDNAANGATSPLCAGSYSSTLSTFGFGPLNTTGGGSHNLAGSACRLYNPV